MFVTNNPKNRKSLLSVITFFSLSAPLFTFSQAQPAKADSNFINCISQAGVDICVEADTSYYNLYTKSGSVTSQKVSIDSGENCPVFGAIETANSQIRVEGCTLLFSRTQQLQGTIKICKSGECKTEPITLNFPNRTMLSDDRFLGTKGYHLYLDGAFAGKVEKVTREEAINHLELTKKTYPNKKIEGYFNGQKIGYELFWNGVRVGFEPSWNSQQAIANLQQNKQAYPNKRVEGVLNGQKIGYELFWDGVRVGFEPNWNSQQAIANFQWNQKTYPNKKVKALLNGQSVSLPSIPSTRPN
jgi:hypothetical protein